MFILMAFGIVLLANKFTIATTKKNLVFEAAILFLSFAVGIGILVTHTDSNRKNNYSNHPTVYEKANWIEVVVREKLKSSPQNNRYIAYVQNVNNQSLEGKILITTPKTNNTKEIVVGHRLRFKTKLIKTEKPKNPNQFDYSAYLKNKQIYAQAFLPTEDIHYHQALIKDVWYYSATLRNTIVTHLEQSGFDKKALPVAMALLLGQQQDIDPNITKDYQYAGAVHILSVSGLHIGFIVLFINFLMRPIPNTQKGRFLKLSISLLSLALFGVLAGLAPSVVRSITMFSFVAIGHYWRRSTNIYHTLVVSIFLILLFQPYFLFDVGFQLSYAALFFIVWLQPMLANYWTPKNKILQFFWDIITVSFAAQLGTLPLSVYYFHQFPGLFFVTNLLVLPLLSVIMLLGVIVMTIAAFSALPIWCIKPLEWGITVMNSIIHWVASFESFIFTNIPSTFNLMLASYCLLIALVLWWKKKTFKRTALVLSTIIVVQIIFIKNKLDFGNSKEWIVLNTSKKTIICQRIGKEIEVISNDLPSNEIQKNMVLQNYATGTFSGITEQSPLKNVAYFNGNRILILDSSSVYFPNKATDVLLLTASPKVNLERIIKNNRPKLVVADASNYKSLVNLWKQTCNQQKIPFHSTREKGYFYIKE
ncbi:ComEC/Rec2 family competence protein [Flavobacterium sp. 9R]|uniref:ComEC/Rec2 family competence protein n=1 Tax=Flavobacterium sp. 9R TaxID=2653143 RepID=UPI001F3116CC|nr:ComEC/Rec2 family competence protein [Flavobacterium sp. 9R]